MSTRLTLRAFAKINFALELLGVRDDGYTELVTIFQTIDLADTLALELDPAGPAETTLETDGLRIDASPQGNLVFKATERWREKACYGGAIRARLSKVVPSEAGLGGGSSDAAAALWGLERLAGAPVGPERLLRIAAELGADVPYFLGGGLALGRGRGDAIELLDDLPSRPLILARAGAGLSTAAVFAGARSGLTPRAKAPNIQRFVDGSGAGLAPLPPVWNDLLPAAGALEPAIPRLIDRLAGLGARAGMTGSGSVVFGLFEEEAEARVAMEALRGLEPDAWMRLSRTLPRDELGDLRVAAAT